MKRRTVLLIVLDGWGIGADNESNPIYVAQPANFKWLGETYPLTSLQASGIAVGLPWGEVGNSEVGHLTIGAGKVVYQYYPKITMAIEDKTFFENKALRDACAHAKKNNSAVHFAGLLTKANVHASLAHLLALIKLAEGEKVPAIRLHLFADGKDSPPHTITSFLKLVPHELVATIIGRHYAMNRSDNWQLIQKAYECMTGQSGQVVRTAEHFVGGPSGVGWTTEEILQATYDKGLSEEFLPPLRMSDKTGIKDGDALVFFNFREDSMIQLAGAFTVPGFSAFPVLPFQNLYVATMTRYSEKFPCSVAFPADTVEKPLGQVFAAAEKSQLRVAETYKHGHVTFFFNGHREEPFPGEYRVLIPSLNTPHPEEHPELMAAAITDRILEAVEGQAFDFILANYSNPDTIAHTGNYNACIEAVKIIDEQIGRILKVVLGTDTVLVITSDHGNLEEVISPVTGRIETQHDVNPVPLYLVAEEFKDRKFYNQNNLRQATTGLLSDVAPTILEIVGLPKPPEMTGRSLLRDLLK